MASAVAGADDSIRLQRIEVERLPDLNIPRNAHSAFCVNGEVTVVGGHTTNFIPTATAEYYRDGQWHLMEMHYAHDNGICVMLSSGKVFLAGGHAEPMGIGQSFAVEEYDPATHTFRGFSCLDQKRTLATGIEVDSGRVAIAGNWYSDDALELFDGDRTCSFAKDVTIDRASPYLLRISDNDVLVLGNGGTHGEMLRSDVVDRLKGEPFHVPLLRQWQPLFYEAPFTSDIGFIGDETRDDYSWLLPVNDYSVGDSTKWLDSKPMAFMLVRDTVFSLLPTVTPAPVTCPLGDIFYYSPCIADRQRHRAYVHGIDKDNRHYVLCVEYDKTPAPLTLYYTDPQPEAGFPEIVLTDDGNLMIVGGITYNKGLEGKLDNDNFSPLASVFLLHVNNESVAEAPESVVGKWLWGILALAILAIAVTVFLFRRQRKRQPPVTDDEPVPADTSVPLPNDALMQRICDLMDQQQVYLDRELKLSDVATLLGTNRNTISACINSQRGCSFSQFVNDYRLRHAKELMLRQPEMKISDVCVNSGFSTESSFFRAFKTATGMTPNEWKAQK